MHIVITYWSTEEKLFIFCVVVKSVSLQLLNLKSNRLQRQKRTGSVSVGTGWKRSCYRFRNNQASFRERRKIRQ